MSSSSSENAPLLNGSQEGPCYAYSYTQSREEEENEEKDSSPSPDPTTLLKEKLPHYLSLFKKIVLLLLIIFCAVTLNFVNGADVDWNSTFISRGCTSKMNITTDVYTREDIVIHLRIKSPSLAVDNEGEAAVTFSLSRLLPDDTHQKISRAWTAFLNPDVQSGEEIILEHDFYLTDNEMSQNKTYQLSASTNVRYVPLSIGVSVKPKVSLKKVIMSTCLLFAFHVSLMLKILPQTLVAMIAAIAAISLLTIVDDQRISVLEVVSWTNLETLSLAFGMLFITSMLCDTGVFEFLAVIIYKLTGGQTWLFLLPSLFLSSAMLSALLDTVTALTLVNAIAIRLGEAMNVDPKNILIALVISSNIGSILGYSTFKKYQTTKIIYSQFALHVFPVVLATLLTAYALWRSKFKDLSLLRFKKPLEVEEVSRELSVWKKAYNSLASYSREEESVKAILERKKVALETLLRRKLCDSKIPTDDYKITLIELTNTMKKRNKHLLYKSCAVVTAVLILLLLRPLGITSGGGWTAILGALCLLVWTHSDDSVESAISRVEWSALLFLTSCHILTEALVRLDLVSFLLQEAQHHIPDEKCTGAGLTIPLIFFVWVSALSSGAALPFSAAMMQLINERHDDCTPIVLALSLGASLGVNGSILGSASNILSSGIAEYHGFRFSYWDFFNTIAWNIGTCISGFNRNNLGIKGMGFAFRNIFCRNFDNE